jgi:hypothetical protein
LRRNEYLQWAKHDLERRISLHGMIFCNVKSDEVNRGFDKNK